MTHIIIIIIISHNGYFVDLFVRVSNSVAISMYEKVRLSYYFIHLLNYDNIASCIIGRMTTFSSFTIVDIYFSLAIVYIDELYSITQARRTHLI